MNYTTQAEIGETTVGGVVGGCCGPLVCCGVCGLELAAGVGTAVGTFILCVACYAGSKFKDLHPVGKGAVVVSSTTVGAFGGASVVESAALGIGLAASTPALITGAAVGIALVGGAVVVGALAAASDEQRDTKERLNKMEAQMDLLMGMLNKEKKKNGGA